MPARKAQAEPRILTVPGLHGSEAGHWQSWIETQFDASHRVEQQAWSEPDLAVWSSAVRARLAALDYPVVLVAHSFGCLAVAEALRAMPVQAAAVLFVAPACPARFGLQDERIGVPLNVPSIVVASENDPWMTLAGASRLAQQWGSELINLGAQGHINVASGFGPWPRAVRLVRRLSVRRACAVLTRTHQAAAEGLALRV